MRLFGVTGLAGVLLVLYPALSSATVVQQFATFGAAEVDLVNATGSVADSVVNASFNFAPFDTTLGTLTNIQLIRTAGISITGSITNTTNASLQVNFFDNATIKIVDPSGPLPGDVLTVNPFNQTSLTLSANETRTFTTASSSVPSSVPISTAAFGNFEAGPFAFDVSTAIIGATFQGVNTLTNIDMNLQANSTAGVYQLDYTYTPNVIDTPEPASLALFGTAVAGLGWMRRRRSTKR